MSPCSMLVHILMLIKGSILKGEFKPQNRLRSPDSLSQRHKTAARYGKSNRAKPMIGPSVAYDKVFDLSSMNREHPSKRQKTETAVVKNSSAAAVDLSCDGLENDGPSGCTAQPSQEREQSISLLSNDMDTPRPGADDPPYSIKEYRSVENVMQPKSVRKKRQGTTKDIRLSDRSSSSRYLPRLSADSQPAVLVEDDISEYSTDQLHSTRIRKASDTAGRTRSSTSYNRASRRSCKEASPDVNSNYFRQPMKRMPETDDSMVDLTTKVSDAAYHILPQSYDVSAELIDHDDSMDPLSADHHSPLPSQVKKRGLHRADIKPRQTPPAMDIRSLSPQWDIRPARITNKKIAAPTNSTNSKEKKEKEVFRLTAVYAASLGRTQGRDAEPIEIALNSSTKAVEVVNSSQLDHELVGELTMNINKISKVLYGDNCRKVVILRSKDYAAKSSPKLMIELDVPHDSGYFVQSLARLSDNIAVCEEARCVLHCVNICCMLI